MVLDQKQEATFWQTINNPYGHVHETLVSNIANLKNTKVFFDDKFVKIGHFKMKIGLDMYFGTPVSMK